MIISHDIGPPRVLVCQRRIRQCSGLQNGVVVVLVCSNVSPLVWSMTEDRLRSVKRRDKECEEMYEHIAR